MSDVAIEAVVEEERLKAILESLLFAAGEPVGLAQLANALDNVPREAIRTALAELAASYASEGRGIVLEEIAGGYQLRTPKEHAFYVRRLLAAKPPRLSRPLLETLAIIAYRQPITRPEIEQLRGVDSGGVLDTLLDRGLVKIAGRKEAPGRPLVYATSSEFLELFGLKDLESLPDLAEFREIEAAREDFAAESSALTTEGQQEPDVEAAATEGQPAELGGSAATEPGPSAATDAAGCDRDPHESN